jgi:hypothetical protein
MTLLLTICSGIFILFGLGLIFSPVKGSSIAGMVCIGSGVYAYDHNSLFPLVVGFCILWILRLLGFERK